ncbi:UBX domain-containing protein 1 [Grifola frondosa]|uniref:UBX domain-containing protein 1 n=1 Tax=Grifola frondosa TaxID=5627 RepID=A0A1C7MA54_GRIFR|nr:UBX domain-containing protein 1 [Grifola frondosa]
MSSSRDRVEETYESQNDERLDQLHSKLRTLRGVTTDIYDDVEGQNSALDNARDAFSSFGTSLAQSSRRAGQAFGIGPGGVKQWRTIGYCAAAFFGLCYCSLSFNPAFRDAFSLSSTMSDKDVLLSMGFDPSRVEWALKATGGRGLQPAMDHILENDGKPVPDLSSVTTGSAGASGGSGSGGAEPMDEDDEDIAALRAVYGKQGESGSGAEGSAVAGEAKSIKCAACGKTFKNTDLANYHAEKSGHNEFEESTEEIRPLTEEEKNQKLAELREKMAAKRAVKAKQEAKENEANEAIRRKAGKDLNAIREEMKAKELIKEAENKRREKLEDAKARAAIKAQIEADRRLALRRQLVRRPSARANLHRVIQPRWRPLLLHLPLPKPPGKIMQRLDCRSVLQAAGRPTQRLCPPTSNALREVAEFLAGQTLAVDVETVNFAMHFPRKTFSRSDFSRTLRELGLTPSARGDNQSRSTSRLYPNFMGRSLGAQFSIHPLFHVILILLLLLVHATHLLNMDLPRARSPPMTSRSRPHGPRSPKPAPKSIIPLDLTSRLEEATPAYFGPDFSGNGLVESPESADFDAENRPPSHFSVASAHPQCTTSDKGIQAPGSTVSTPAPTRASTPAFKVIPKRSALAPPPTLNFDPAPIAWKGMPLEAAQWTLTSEQLQETVSRAIRQSAQESFIRLVSSTTLDEELPAELAKLESMKATTQSQYRFNMHRRTMLLQSLNALSQSPAPDDGEALFNLTTQLAEVTVACDRLMETLVRISDQRAQIHHVQDVHIASALAMALRKLNASYARRTAELQEVHTSIEAMKAELEEAWDVAEDMAQEMDDLDNFHTGFSDDEGANEAGMLGVEEDYDDDLNRRSAVPSVKMAEVIEITGKAVAMKATLTNIPGSHVGDRTSRVIAAKKRSSRTSKASLRIPKTPTGERTPVFSRRSSRSKSIRRRSTEQHNVPQVPALQMDSATSLKAGSFLELSETRPVSPTSAAAQDVVSSLPTVQSVEVTRPEDASSASSIPIIQAPPSSPGFEGSFMPIMTMHGKSASQPDRTRQPPPRRVQSLQPPRASDDSVIGVLKRSISEVKQFDGWPWLRASNAQRFSVPLLSSASTAAPTGQGAESGGKPRITSGSMYFGLSCSSFKIHPDVLMSPLPYPEVLLQNLAVMIDTLGRIMLSHIATSVPYSPTIYS